MPLNNDSKLNEVPHDLMISHCVHELKTPLQTILGTICLLKETGLNSEQAEYLSHIEYGADVLKMLTSDVLDIAKIHQNQLKLTIEPFDIKSTTESIVNMISIEAFKKNLEIVSDIDYSIPDLVEGDQLRYKQILLNLLGNALKFTSDGYIHTELSFAGPEHLEFRITDSGRGIKEENREKIFETYFQENDEEENNSSSAFTKYTGSGLGLAICKGLITIMGGTIKYERNPFGGSVFSCVFPLREVKKAEDQMYDITLPANSKILIVDASKLSANSLSRKLKALGIQNIQFSSNAKEALLTMEYAANMEDPFSIVFIDMHIPIYDGWELSSRIRKKDSLKNTRLFLMVQEGKLSQRARGHVKKCFEDFIYKPLQIGRLREILREKSSDDYDDIISNAIPAEEVVKNDQKQFSDFLKGKKVLVAEDDKVNRSIQTELLKKTGAQVIECQNGDEVLKKIQETSDFEIIFLDLNMPSLNGRETAKKLREDGIKSVLVACTAEDAKDIRNELKADGFNYALQKPYKIENIYSLLSKIEEDKNLAKRRKIWDFIEFESTIGGDEKLGKKLLSEFLSQTQNLLMSAQDSCEKNDFSQLKQIFHKLKGSAMTISQKQLEKLSQTIEDACSRGDTPVILESLAELKDAFWSFRQLAENWHLQEK
ncbi:MAG: response regulator [Treponema sp.]|nr:response regulator [Treponema sp.]